MIRFVLLGSLFLACPAFAAAPVQPQPAPPPPASVDAPPAVAPPPVVPVPALAVPSLAPVEVARLHLHLHAAAVEIRSSRHIGGALGLGMGAAAAILTAGAIWGPHDDHRTEAIIVGAALTASEVGLGVYNLGSSNDLEKLDDLLEAAPADGRGELGVQVEAAWKRLDAQRVDSARWPGVVVGVGGLAVGLGAGALFLWSDSAQQRWLGLFGSTLLVTGSLPLLISALSPSAPSRWALYAAEKKLDLQLGLAPLPGGAALAMSGTLP
jgi:hypothetical protein